MHIYLNSSNQHYFRAVPRAHAPMFINDLLKWTICVVYTCSIHWLGGITYSCCCCCCWRWWRCFFVFRNSPHVQLFYICVAFKLLTVSQQLAFFYRTLIFFENGFGFHELFYSEKSTFGHTKYTEKSKNFSRDASSYAFSVYAIWTIS